VSFAYGSHKKNISLMKP